MTQITGPWALSANVFAPQLITDHPLEDGVTCVDISGVPAAVGVLFTVEVTGASDTWLAAVQADPTYTVL